MKQAKSPGETGFFHFVLKRYRDNHSLVLKRRRKKETDEDGKHCESSRTSTERDIILTFTVVRDWGHTQHKFQNESIRAYQLTPNNYESRITI